MGILTGQALYAQAAEILEDTTYVTYLETQLLPWINDAQRAVVLVRPDANSTTEVVSLAPNTAFQTLPAGVLRLGGILQNMGADGATPGKAVRGPVPQETLDSVSPDWMTTTGAYVREYMYDEAFPGQFLINPPVASTWWLRLKTFRSPTDLSAKTDPITLADIYAPAIVEWLLYRTFARDSERTPNFVRASRHFSNFFQFLGVKTRADLAVSPKVLEYDRQMATK